MNHRVVLVAVFTVFFVHVVLSALFTPMTYDEPLHIASGYTKFWLHDFRMNTEHPPLAHYLQGLVVSFAQPTLNLYHSSWTQKNMTEFSQRFFFVDNSNPRDFLLPGRLPSIMLSLVLALIVYLFAKELFGPWAGVLAVGMLAIEPNIIAHGSLATTDISFTTFFMGAVYSLYRFVHKPGRDRLFVFSIAFALVQLTKYTALVTAPLLLGLLVVSRLWRKHSMQQVHTVVSEIAVVAAVTWLVVNAAYFFSGTGTPIGIAMASDHSLQQQYAPQKILQGFPDWIVYSLPSPLPYPYVKGLGFVLFESKSVVPVKLFDSTSTTGFRSYYVFAFLLKTPLPIVVLILLSVILVITRRKLGAGELVLLASTAFFFAAFSFTSKQIGIRHILPVYPLLFIFSSQLIRVKKMWWVVVMCLVLTTASIASIMPKPLSYYNELVGSSNGWKVFADSNTDWGQDVDELVQYARAHNLSEISASVLTTQVMSFYNLTPAAIPSSCTAGVHIVSAHALYLGNAQWLQEYQFTERVGTSIFVYNISQCRQH